MSDDLFDTFGGDFEEEEEVEQVVAADGSNRTFIIAVAVLGGLLVCSLIAFGVWAFILNRPQPADEAPTDVPAAAAELEAEATATAEWLAAVALTETAEVPPTPTNEPEPTATATPVVAPTATPTAEGMAEGEPTATLPPRRTPTPTPLTLGANTEDSDTANPGSTSYSVSTGELAQTGMGEWLMVGAAAMLIAVMVAARKMRSA